MNATDFNRHLPAFHKLILDFLTSSDPLTITNNYVKTQGDNVYNMLTLRLADDTIDLSVVFDRFFQVPVLYFRVNGAMDYLPGCGVMSIHLVLNVPFLMVHPCESEHLMATINPTTPLDYLKSWFGITVQLAFSQILLRVPS